MDWQARSTGFSVSFNDPQATSSPNKSPTLKVLIENLKSTVDSVVKEEKLKTLQVKEEFEKAVSLMLTKDDHFFQEDYYTVKYENEENINPKTSKKEALSANKENLRKIKSGQAKKRKIIKGIIKQMENYKSDRNSSSITTRSKSRQMNNLTPSTASAQTSSSDRCATPLMSRGNYKIAAVTPKRNISSSPAFILRRPNPGEVAISLTGSPLMIASQGGPTTVPHVNIPLRDGRVMAVLGTDGLNANDFPELDDTQTIEQLRKLHEFLGQFSHKDNK